VADVSEMTDSVPISGIDLEPPAADWLEVWPEDRHPYGFEPRSYVTEVSVPGFGDDGIQRLHSRMLPVEPLPEPETGL